MNKANSNETIPTTSTQAPCAIDWMSGQPKPTYKVLTLDDIRLLADALRGVGSVVERCPDYLDELCEDQSAFHGESIMARTVEAAILDDELDTKWDVLGKDLLRKIRQLPGESRRTIVVGVVEFWEKSACGKDEEVLHGILDEVNTARISAKTW